MVFDTAAGEATPEVFARELAPHLHTLARAFPGRLGYYAKGLRREHLTAANWSETAPWAGLGLDWHWDLAGALTAGGRAGFVQGNFDPSRLLASGPALDDEIARFVAPLRDLDQSARRGWICGLGHGVLPGTPESSVRTFVQRVRESFA
jgi:uroporphyrinogen decarboxylase